MILHKYDIEFKQTKTLLIIKQIENYIFVKFDFY